MRKVRWSLVRQQMAVQLLVRTLNFNALGLLVLQPFVFSAVGMLLSHAAGNAVPDLIYSVIGGGIMGMWSGIVFTSSYDIRGDRYTGILEMIVGSPTSLESITAIRSVTNVLAGLVSVFLAFLSALAIFHFSLSSANLWGAAISYSWLIFSSGRALRDPSLNSWKCQLQSYADLCTRSGYYRCGCSPSPGSSPSAGHSRL